MEAVDPIYHHRCNGRVPSPDRNRNRPTNWSQRHQRVLELYLAGERTSEIAKELGYSAGRVSTIINSPLFQERKLKLLQELRGTSFDDLLARVSREALPNFECMVEMRDDPCADPRVRLRAAKAIGEQIHRLCPSLGEEVAERSVTVTLDRQALHQLTAAMAEDAGKPPPAWNAGIEECDPDLPPGGGFTDDDW